MELSVWSDIKQAITDFENDFQSYGTVKKISAWFFIVILLPFAAEASVAILGFGLLIPLGLCFCLLEQRAPPLWAVMVTLIHMIACVDVAMDIALLSEVVQNYLDYSNPASSKYKSSDAADETKLFLFLSRSIFTLIGAVPAAFILLRSGIAESGGGAIGIFMLAILWKGIIGLIRLVLIVVAPLSIFYRLLKPHNDNNDKLRWLTQAGECLALMDLMWSSIPLGVQTGMELLYFNTAAHISPTHDNLQLLEVLKLIAMTTNIIGASYFVYFGLLGWEKSMPWVHRLQHPHIHHNHRRFAKEEEEEGDEVEESHLLTTTIDE